MQGRDASQAESLDALDDAELVRLARANHGNAFRAIMQRNNRRLYRVARSVVRDDGEAEDVVQEAYVRAFGCLEQFRGDARLATWLSRIVLNEALGRLRRARPTVELATLDAESFSQSQIDPEHAAAQREIRHLIEDAIDGLPEIFRMVFVMREIEEMSIEETAGILSLEPATVKTRLHRARRLLRRVLDEQLASTLSDAFPFEGRRCKHTADLVLKRLQLEAPPG